MNHARLRELAETRRGDLIAFAQKLVQTPSMPGQEGGVAALLQAEMARLGYDEVWVDEVGNVLGRIAGAGGPSLLFNGHMDHVDPGDPGLWPHPPFGGEIHDGELWGRGAADMKGALAAMVHAGGLIVSLGTMAPGVVPPGDLIVSAVVQEEVGGLGARHLARTLPLERVVVGEASDNHLRRGHRGRVELNACFEGRSVHASMPALGVNPHDSLARFLAGLRGLTSGSIGDLQMAVDPDYGQSTVAPTCITSEPQSANVTPARLDLILDWRNIPGEGPGEIVAKLEALLARSLEPGCRGSIQVVMKELVSYTGFRVAYPDTFPSFTTPADHPWLQESRALLAETWGREVGVGTWRFATDGGHLAAAGATVIGFGPGDDALVHTVEERLPLDQLVESMVGYAALGMGEGHISRLTFG
jgi:succinyl-diaminopimelate desuccinylase